MVGWRLKDPAWKDHPRPIKDVIINPKEGYYLLRVGNDKPSNKDKYEQLKQWYHEQGWNPPGEKQGLERIWPALGKKKRGEEQGP